MTQSKDTVKARLLVNHTGLGRAGEVVDMPAAQFHGNRALGLCLSLDEEAAEEFETAEQDDSTVETADAPTPKSSGSRRKKKS